MSSSWSFLRAIDSRFEGLKLAEDLSELEADATMARLLRVEAQMELGVQVDNDGFLHEWTEYDRDIALDFITDPLDDVEY